MNHPDQNQTLLTRCAAIDVNTWSDALDQLDLQGLLEGLSQRSGAGRMCGFARTVRQVPGRLHDFDKADFAIGRVVDLARPGTVLVIDVGGEPISTMGGLAASAAHRQGVEGVVIDGACRDLGEIRDTGLWLASRWVSPRTGKGRLRTQQFGEAVCIAGRQVAQGDLIVGDETGIVVIAAQRLQEVLQRAEAILSLDKEVERRMRAGETFGDAALASGYIPAKESAPS